MQEHEVRAIIQQVHNEKIRGRKDRGTFLEESTHAYHHKWIADRIEMRKTIRKRLVIGVITILCTVVGAYMVAKYIDKPHTHLPLEIPDIPEGG